MKTATPSHYWTVPAEPAGTQARGPGLPTAPRPVIEVRSHRRLRGPYTGAGAVLRHAVPELMAIDRELVAARAAEIVTMAPELTAIIPAAPQTLTNLASSEERTRFYPAVRTLRLSHGATELLTDWARLAHPGGVVLSFLDLDDADPCDREFVSVLLRRCDPAVLTVIAEAGGPQPGRTAAADDPLGKALARYATQAARNPQPAPDRPGASEPAGWRALTSPSSSSIQTARTRTRRYAGPTRPCPPTTGQAGTPRGRPPWPHSTSQVIGSAPSRITWSTGSTRLAPASRRSPRPARTASDLAATTRRSTWRSAGASWQRERRISSPTGPSPTRRAPACPP